MDDRERRLKKAARMKAEFLARAERIARARALQATFRDRMMAGEKDVNPEPVKNKSPAASAAAAAAAGAVSTGKREGHGKTGVGMGGRRLTPATCTEAQAEEEREEARRRRLQRAKEQREALLDRLARDATGGREDETADAGADVIKSDFSTLGGRAIVIKDKGNLERARREWTETLQDDQ